MASESQSSSFNRPEDEYSTEHQNAIGNRHQSSYDEFDDHGGESEAERADDEPLYEAVRTWSSQPLPELARIASAFSRVQTQRTAATREGPLERTDTLAGVRIGDPVLDPTKPEFDFYKWSRMLFQLMEDEGIKNTRTGVTFKNLSISGSGAPIHYQETVLSPFLLPFRLGELLWKAKKPEKIILHNFNGLVNQGELLIVLGRPGSGCSTLLKSISGDLHGLKKRAGSEILYNGVPQSTFQKEFRGEAVYSAEDEQHFPHLTVWQTLKFAAAARTPSARVLGLTRERFATHLTKVMMSVYGLSHTVNTKVGNDYVRGVSGGERKRVSIAEMALASAQICCWDNSTRGLDSATALEFAKALKVSSQVGGMTQCLAIYQASQAIYDLFDKAVVLYEGRQIFFGPADGAKEYFETMGWYCPPRQTTADFLTSVTNPTERVARAGFESKVPRTAIEFERYWHESQFYKALALEMDTHETQTYSQVDGQLQELREAQGQAKAKHVPKRSPFLISLPMQIRLCTVRAYQRLWGDKSSTVSTVVSQTIMALIIGSLFFNTPKTTASFFAKGSVLFFAILLNALMSITEINGLCTLQHTKDEQRPIVVKQVRFAFYRAFAEAAAGLVADFPIKFLTAAMFNVTLYFLGDLSRTAKQFFIFFLFTFITMLVMSTIFRSLAAATKTIPQALTLAGVMVLAIVIYTGFTIQRSYMHKWFEWISWINPVAFGFEAILVNEVHNSRFQCANPVPPYGTGNNFACPVAGAVPGEMSVSGDAWVKSSYGYSYTHLWRNLGILLGFLFFFWFVYLVISELNLSSSSAAEYLIFRRGYAPKSILNGRDEETTTSSEPPVQSIQAGSDETSPNANPGTVLPPQKDIFTWNHVTYDISIKGEPRRLLDNVAGWVRPGTLTALMGVSGAGKTTLLDALAQRTTTGVISGDMLVNGKPLDSSFQRKTGYVQQQDLHLETTTVREALQFSALLRQPKTVSKKEKYEFVESIIQMLNMQDFSEAVVGSPGEGLNVEQRKLLTIGVELAAKPQLLLFLDEPTSGLDSQSSWAIVQFLRKLADNGQAVLSTIHQPSAVLFQEFDRLLFLAKGGKTVYFGDIGHNSQEILKYFADNGAEECGPSENPAEYILNAVGAGPGGASAIDWPAVWKESDEAARVQLELERIHSSMPKEKSEGEQEAPSTQFAMPFTSQVYYVTVRVFQQYWRTPTYIWGKLMLGFFSAVFIGFSFFLQNQSITGLQNSIFSIFMFVTILSSLVQQIMPRFVTQRSLFEVRERPSRAYSWQAFILANIVVEIPYQILLGIISWASLFYPVFGIISAQRTGLLVLYSTQFFIFASTFAHMVIAGLPDAETAGGIATTLFSLMLTFNGVLQTPSALPGFWIFMWRVSPLTYTVGGIAATTLHAREVRCAENEFAVFDPPQGMGCREYLARFLEAGAPGQLVNPAATNGSVEKFLSGLGIYRVQCPGDDWAVLFDSGEEAIRQSAEEMVGNYQVSAK
ncbi:GTPase-activating protein [Myotisia sp. PD_48]|nr:GTPase-activating protein [Myotisia sp. PD_48]